MMTGAERIAAERQRQIEVEGWTAEHDSEHQTGGLVRAAAQFCNESCCCCLPRPRRQGHTMSLEGNQMQSSDLWIDDETGSHRATLPELVRVWFNEGAEMVDSWNAPIGSDVDYYEVLSVVKPGRYLIYGPIPPDKDT